MLIDITADRIHLVNTSFIAAQHFLSFQRAGKFTMGREYQSKKQITIIGEAACIFPFFLLFAQKKQHKADPDICLLKYKPATHSMRFAALPRARSERPDVSNPVPVEILPEFLYLTLPYY